MPAAATVDRWQVVLDNLQLPTDEWLRIVQNRIINSGDAAGTLVAEWALVDEADGTMLQQLCTGSVSLDAGATAAMTRVGDDGTSPVVCEVHPVASDEIGPLMYKAQPDGPETLVFAFRTYVDGNTPPPWPGQDEGEGGQTARTTVTTVPEEALFGLNTARKRVVAGAGAGSVAAVVLKSLIGA